MSSLRTAPSIVPLLGVLMVLMSAFGVISGSVQILVPRRLDDAPICDGAGPAPMRISMALHADLGATVCIDGACHRVDSNRIVPELVRAQLDASTKPREPKTGGIDQTIYLAVDDAVPWGLFVSTASAIEYATVGQVRVVAIDEFQQDDMPPGE